MHLQCQGGVWSVWPSTWETNGSRPTLELSTTQNKIKRLLLHWRLMNENKMDAKWNLKKSPWNEKNIIFQTFISNSSNSVNSWVCRHWSSSWRQRILSSHRSAIQWWLSPNEFVGFPLGHTWNLRRTSFIASLSVVNFSSILVICPFPQAFFLEDSLQPKS